MAFVAGEMNPHRLNPIGRARRNPLLVHLLAVGAARKAVKHAWALTQRTDDPASDGQVITGQVELGLSSGREIHPVGAREPDGALPDTQLNLRGTGAHPG